MKYTIEQQQAINDCIDFIHNPLDPRPHFTLTGSPGTGKTVSVKGILEKCTSKQVAAVTVSHVANNVLSENLGNLNVQCMTIAKLVGAVPNMNNSKDDVKFIINDRISKISMFDLIVIDETSMIDQFHYEVLMTYKKPGTKLLFIGDKNQLPPVDGGGAQSPTLKTIDAQLNKVMRFKGPISHIVEEAKHQIELLDSDLVANPHFLNSVFGRNGRISKMDGTTGYIFLNNNMHMFELFVKEYRNDPDNINNTRVLLFRNDYVVLANQVIRGMLYGKNLGQFEKGELIVSNGGFRKKKSSVIYNRETYKVTSFKENVMVGKEGDAVECVELILHPQPHEQARILTPSTKGLTTFNHNLDKIAARCRLTNQWKPYHEYKNQFSWWDYTYAQNLYLAQGKTYNSVFVVESEIQDVKPLKLKQKLQALYVGLSRAKERLYIYNKKYKADGSAYTNQKDFTKLFNSAI